MSGFMECEMCDSGDAGGSGPFFSVDGRYSSRGPSQLPINAPRTISRPPEHCPA